MPKKKQDQPTVEAQLKATQQALSEARSGLLRISSIDPVRFTTPGGVKTLGIVRALDKAQEVAEKALLTSSDAEQAVYNG